MGPGSRLREFIPVLLAVVLVASIVAVLFEVVIDTSRGVPLDPVAVPVLGTLAGACITALAGFYAVDGRTPRDRDPDPPDGPHERPRMIQPTGDPESDDWNRDHGWLELRKVGRWRPCSVK